MHSADPVRVRKLDARAVLAQFNRNYDAVQIMPDGRIAPANTDAHDEHREAIATRPLKLPRTWYGPQ